MPQNKGLGGKYPSTFCEWVVGQSIESALGIRPQKANKQRGIVRVEVTTDDETEEDSLKVTYPRSGRSGLPKTTKSVVKKVRFVDAPKKSAMKKATAASSESEGEASESAASTKSDKETTEAESSDASSKKSPKGKRSKKKAISSDSEPDSEPHPTCKCARCARGRRKSKKCAKADEASESEVSVSEADSTPKAKNQDSGKPKKKGGKKGGEKKDGSEADDEESESAKATEDETEAKSPKTEVEKNKQESDKQKGRDKQQNKGNANQKGGNKQGKANNKETAEPQKEHVSTPEKAADSTKKKSKHRSGNKNGDYPEAFLAPHPRRPNLIEPIRAEVVQTERVVESPEDPPPNAYYDPEHGVLRVYHGPVYGSSQGHALYPRRDASGRPLPVGMPHPTQNPYYYGFNQAPPQQGQEHVPITQGMPFASYKAMCPPPAFAPGFPGGFPSGFPQGGPPGIWQDPNVNPNPNPNGNKGAFSMSDANGGSPFSKNKDKDGANNVAPPGSVKVGHRSPCYLAQHADCLSISKTTPTISRESHSLAHTVVGFRLMPAKGAARITPPVPIPRTQAFRATMALVIQDSLLMAHGEAPRKTTPRGTMLIRLKTNGARMARWNRQLALAKRPLAMLLRARPRDGTIPTKEMDTATGATAPGAMGMGMAVQRTIAETGATKRCNLPTRVQMVRQASGRTRQRQTVRLLWRLAT